MLRTSLRNTENEEQTPPLLLEDYAGIMTLIPFHVIVLPLILTFILYCSRISDIIHLKQKLERISERRYPCLTPTVFLTHSHAINVKNVKTFMRIIM